MRRLRQGARAVSNQPPHQQPPAGKAPPGTVLVDFSEKALIDAYTDAIKGGLTALNGVADKVLTAAFSLATALAAVIGLVSPKDEPGPIATGAPFVGFALAALAALIALVFYVSPAEKPTSDEVTKPIKDALFAKKVSVLAAVVLLAAATATAVLVVLDAYGPRAAKRQSPDTTIVAISPEKGADAISLACPASKGSITGTVDLDSLGEDFIEIDVPEGMCGDSATTVRIPKDQVRILSTPAGQEPATGG